MEFLKCKYYEESIKKGHCPFDSVCETDCYFTLRKISEGYDELAEQVRNHNAEINDYDYQVERVQELEEDVEDLEDNIDEMSDFIVKLIEDKRISKLEVPTDNSWAYKILRRTKENNMEMNQYEVGATLVKMPIKMVIAAQKYTPTYANSTDAKMDLKIVVPEGKYVLQPNETKLFGTGVKMAIPEGYGVEISPRSSTGCKLHINMANTIGTIDAGYRDEIGLFLHNFGTEPVELVDAQRIAQFKIERKIEVIPVLVNDNEEFRQGDRGGGFGSTGKQ